MNQKCNLIDNQFIEVINLNGTKTKYEKRNANLKWLQHKVGGYIQVVNCKRNGKLCEMIINEEGKVLEMPMNIAATMLYREAHTGSGDWIAGVAVVLVGFNLD